MIKQISVMDTEFKKYGKVIEGYDLKEILQKMEETPCPDDVVYVASVKELEELKIAEELADGVYGQMPVQIGYCNGHNRTYNLPQARQGSHRPKPRGNRQAGKPPQDARARRLPRRSSGAAVPP